MIQNLKELISGEPKAVQCLWYSDWEYLSLSIEIVYKTFSGYKKIEVEELNYVKYDSQEELVKEGMRIGKGYAKKYDIEFYFPSPNESSRDCPNWWEVEKTPLCEDCKTPIIPAKSQYLPKEVCYPCHLQRESNQSIINENPSGNGISVFLTKGKDYVKLGDYGKFETLGIAPFIKYKIPQNLPNEGISLVTLNKNDIEKLIKNLEKELDQEFLSYEKPQIKKHEMAFANSRIYAYKKKDYKLIMKFNPHHEKLIRLLGSLETAQKAINEKYELNIYFTKGLNSRDDSFLRFVHFVEKGTSSEKRIEDRYGKILSINHITKTLEKLKRLELIKYKKDKIVLSDKAQKVLLI